MESNQLLTYVLFTPLIGAMLLLVFQREHEQEIRVFGFVISIITFILSLMIFAKFESLNPGFQFVHKIPWITNLYISYHVGVDGLSMLLLLLTTFITPLTLLSSWKSINKKVKEFTFFMLLLEVGMIGVFVSLDLFLFYVFWEATLIPMYFIIGIWGGVSAGHLPCWAFLTAPGNGLSAPWGITVVGSQVWVANVGAFTISRFNLDGTVYSGGNIAYGFNG